MFRIPNIRKYNISSHYVAINVSCIKFTRFKVFFFDRHFGSHAMLCRHFGILWVLRVTKTIRTANCLRLNVTVNQKFRNVAFHCPFKNASEKSSLCHWFLKNMDKPYYSPSKLGTVYVMEDYFLLIFNTNISFSSCNRRSTIDIRHSPRQHFLK